MQNGPSLSVASQKITRPDRRDLALAARCIGGVQYAHAQTPFAPQVIFAGTERTPVNPVTSRIRLDAAHAPSLRRTIERACTGLLGKQRPDGHWVGELQGDTILESEFVLLLAFLGRESEERTR